MNLYKTLSNNRICKNVILGDSRLVKLRVEGYDNLSIPGITLAAMRDNLPLILEKDTDKVVISLGVNDLLNRYELKVVKDNFNYVVNTMLSLGIEVTITNVVYTLLSELVSNDKILEINNFIYKLAKEKNLNFIDINKELIKDNSLRLDYTYDGIHFNEIGEKLLFNKIISKL